MANKENVSKKNRFEEENPFIERVVSINRVTKVVKGGKHFRFAALVVVGDGQGNVGAAIGKAQEVAMAIRKGMENARKDMMKVPIIGTTIPHRVENKFSGSRVILRPASPGTGVTAGRAVRAVIEATGIKDILTKCLGSKNPINIVYSTLQALGDLEDLYQASQRRMVPTEKLKVNSK